VKQVWSLVVAVKKRVIWKVNATES